MKEVKLCEKCNEEVELKSSSDVLVDRFPTRHYELEIYQCPKCKDVEVLKNGE